MSSHGSYLGSSAINCQTIASDSVTVANRHRLLFASEYYYKRPGLAHIQSTFENQLDQLGPQELSVKLNYDPQNNTFHIDCAPGMSKIVWKIFHTVLTTMVNEECKKSALIHKNENDLDSSDEEFSSDEDELDFDEDLVLISDKIGRLETSKSLFQNIDTPVYLPEALDMPIQVRNQRFKKIFNWDDALFCMDSVFTDSILQELAILTNSIFVTEADKTRIYIGNNKEDSLHATISKMNNLKNYNITPKTFVHHSFYSESETNVQFSFLKLPSMKNRYFKTTILESFTLLNSIERSKQFSSLLEEAVTIRCASFDRLSATYRILWRLKITPVIKREDIKDQLRAWEKAKYPARGTRKDAFEIFQKIHINSSKTAISKNLKNTASHNQTIKSKVDAGPIISNWVQDVVQSSATKDDQSNESALNQWEVPEKRSQKGVWDSFPEIKPSKPGEVPQPKTDLKSLRPSLKLTRNLPSRAQTDSQNSITSESPRDFWSRYSKATIPQDDVVAKRGVKPKNPDLLPKKSDQTTQPTQNLLDDSTSNFVWDVLTPRKNETKKVGKIKKDSSSIVHQNTSQTGKISSVIATEYKIRANDALKHGSLFEISPSSSSNKEPAGLVISNTKSSRPKNSHVRRHVQSSYLTTKESPTKSLAPTPIANNTSEVFNEDIGSAFRSLMAKVIASSEEAVIQANFGRIILHGIHNTFVSNKGESERTYEEARTRGILMDAGINFMLPSFTKVITTIPAEIRHISEVKDEYGNQYWARKDNQAPLHYELYFLDKMATANNKLMVEINAKNYAINIKKTSELANIYVHGAKRFWDFRISATGTGNRKHLEIIHRELIEMISSSLFTPEDNLKPNLTFEIKHPTSQRYFLHRAAIRHVDRFISRDNESILQISEVQSLDFLVREYPAKKLSIFHTFVTQGEEDSHQNLKLWYEVAISSKGIDDALSKYQGLELGELPDWHTKSLESSFSPRSIYLPACWMLRTLDGIGNHNDNGLEIGKSSPTRSSLHQSTASVYYW
ncbi:hypothetical protein GcM3_097017 [Golovinomyces cichoracearum]|uniref:Uncharacterized protein n=1 Tax=Golovinomyces cichoracearum TaxID=62708 RepID=A0A420IDR6_9PEZI|nr:hypothetical protein GcM3_097017 [Golovinomyces cichoracearum]